MQNLRKLFVLITSCVLLLMVIPGVSTVAAAEPEKMDPLAPTEGVPSPFWNYGEGTTEPEQGFMTLAANKYLKVGRSMITVDGNKVVARGQTDAYSTVDTIGVSVYLQRWNSSKGVWEDVATIGRYYTNFKKTIMGGKSVTVPRGYYYRTRTYHWTTKVGKVESRHGYSAYVQVK